MKWVFSTGKASSGASSYKYCRLNRLKGHKEPDLTEIGASENRKYRLLSGPNGGVPPWSSWISSQFQAAVREHRARAGAPPVPTSTTFETCYSPPCPSTRDRLSLDRAHFRR